jgi:ParB family chromosome partitioning protein
MTQCLSVRIADLKPDPTQPRTSFVGAEIQRLADSISARGVLTPLRIIRSEQHKCWLIVTGESRWRAAQLAGLDEVPCIVVEGQPDEADLLADRIIENHVRSDLSAIELGRAIVKMKRLRGCTAQVLGKELGISGSELSKMESILGLPATIQALVEDGAVPVSIAYEISRLKGEEAAQRELALDVASGKKNRKAVAEAVAAQVGTKQLRAKDWRLTCRVDGVAVSLSADAPLALDKLVSVLRRLLREAATLKKGGKSAADLAARLKSS